MKTGSLLALYIALTHGEGVSSGGERERGREREREREPGQQRRDRRGKCCEDTKTQMRF